MSIQQPVPHQKLLDELIGDLESKEVKYYRRDSSANYVAWHLLTALSILLGAASSLVAGIVPLENLKDPWPHGLLVALPIVGAVAATFLRAFSFKERERNRELGLIEAERQLRLAKSKRAAATTEAEFKDAYLQVVEDLAKLSRDQHLLDVATRRDEAQTGSGRAAR